MLTGLDILLARMKTNPEEFLSKDGVAYDGEVFGGKWSDLLDYAWRIATDEEQEMIKKARDEFYRDDFNERVMKRLAGEEKQGEKEETMKIRMGARYSASWSDPRGMAGTLNTNTLMVGSQTFEEYEQQAAKLRMQLQEQAMREEMARRQKDAMRQSKTPFGGLGAGKGGLLGWW
jgi:hypothetical protein